MLKLTVPKSIHVGSTPRFLKCKISDARSLTMDDDDNLKQSSDSVSTSDEFEIIEDVEPKLYISGNGGLEQLKMYMHEILDDEAKPALKHLSSQQFVMPMEGNYEGRSVYLNDIHIESSEMTIEAPEMSVETSEMSVETSEMSIETSEISVEPSEMTILTRKNPIPSLDSKLSIYTLSPSPTDEDLMSISAYLDYHDYIVFDGLVYFGADIVSSSATEIDLKKSMVEMNDPSSSKKHLPVSLLINSEGHVVLYEQSSCNEITSFAIHQMKNYFRGDPDSRESSCLALVQEKNDSPSESLSVCHHFKCEGPEAASKIVQCLLNSSKKESKMPASNAFDTEQPDIPMEHIKDNIHTFVFEANLEFKEDDGKGGFTSCPKDKDYFKLRCKLEKTVIVNVKQVCDSRELHIDRCFGLLISPGRNVRNCDMQLVEMVSFCKSSFGERATYCVTGQWDPNEPVFEILNKETPKDTRVYLTVAVDLVIAGIQEPVRFVIETKAKLLPQNDRFWYKTKKSFREHFYLNLKEANIDNGNNDQLLQVLNLDSSSRIQRKKEALRLNLNNPASRSSPPSTSSPQDPKSETDNDEPLLSGTGDVSKDCTETELEGWSEVLLKWRMNLNQRPRHLTTLVKRGIPEALRGEVWQLLAGCHDHREFVDTYKSLLNKDCPCESVIQRDINRTFPAHDLFKDKGGIGQESLFKICKAYSLYDLEVEYCQGLSFLVAALLLHMPEEQAFGVFIRIMYNYHIRDMFRNGFEELHLRFFQLQRLIEDQMPELFNHFQDLGIEIHMFASQWFLTLFTAKFPLIVVFFIVDLFLLDAIDVIFQVSVALLMLSKKELLALDFEGVLKHFRVSLPKKYRTEDSARQLIHTTVKVKVKKLEKYKKEYNAIKEQEKFLDDPLQHLQKENKRLLENNMHLDQENDDLAYEFINMKLQLREKLIKAEENAETLTKDLLNVEVSFSEVEEVKKRLEIEVAQLKEMCRRELQRAESENIRNSSIIAEYKQICSQLSGRLEKEQTTARQHLESFKEKVVSCTQCSKFFDKLQSNSLDPKVESQLKGQIQPMPKVDVQANALELELAQTKLALVEAECKNQDLNHQLNIAISELQSSKNTWLQKTLSTIRDAGKKELSSNRENKDFG